MSKPQAERLVDATDRFGMSPLHVASRLGLVPIVEVSRWRRSTYEDVNLYISDFIPKYVLVGRLIR